MLFNQRRERWHACLYLHFNQETLLFHMMIWSGLFEVEKKLQALHKDCCQRKAWTLGAHPFFKKTWWVQQNYVTQRSLCGSERRQTPFMWPGPWSTTKGHCFYYFAKQCAAACPTTLTLTKLQKHAATSSTMLNMTNTETDQLANLLGHNIRVHRWYNLPPENTTF